MKHIQSRRRAPARREVIHLAMRLKATARDYYLANHSYMCIKTITRYNSIVRMLNETKGV